jgi:DNA-binding MarR family transcriptional regulator
MADALKRRLSQTRFESPQHEAVLSLMVAAAHLRAQLDAASERHGVTASQYNVLRILRGAHPGGYSRCEIARRMIERAPDVTRLIDRMVKLRLVERARSDEDRRLSITRITRKGLGVLERMQAEIDAIHGDLTSRLSEGDAQTLSRLCEIVFDARR